MTITIVPSRNEFISGAGQTVFNYTFKIFATGELAVFVTPVGQAPDDAADLTTDFVIDPGTIGDPAGGFITFNTPLNAGDAVTIISDIPFDRTVDYQNNGDFLPTTVNNDNDRQVAQIKQILETTNKGVVFGQASQLTSGLIYDDPIADAFLSWKTDLSGVKNVTLSSSGIQKDISVINLATLRALDSSTFTDGQVITVTESAGSGGDFVVSTGTVIQSVGVLEPFTDDANRFADLIDKTKTLVKGADVASAAILVLGFGNYFDVTGSANIEQISIPGIVVGTPGALPFATLHFDGTLILEHDPNKISLPGLANITTAAGDEAKVVEISTGNFRCINYTRADGSAINSVLYSRDTIAATAVNDVMTVDGYGESATAIRFIFTLPVITKTPPTGITISSATHFQAVDTGVGLTLTGLTFAAAGNTAVRCNATVSSGAVAFRPYYMQFINASGSIQFTGQTYD